MHISLTVHGNLWALKGYNLSEFPNVISDNPPPPYPNDIITQNVRKQMCDSPLTNFSSYLFSRIKIVPIPVHESSKPISLIKRKIEYLTKALLPRFSKIITIVFQVSVGKSFTAIWEWLHSRNLVFLISKYWQDRAYSNT